MSNIKLYRFRSIKSLLEYKELEENYFYFASKEELNDPMEGAFAFYFKGDNILWRNLFSSYFESLFRTILTIQLNVEQKDYLDYANLVNVYPISEDINEFIKGLKEAKSSFIKHKDIEEIIESFHSQGTKVKEVELELILKSVLNIALEIISETFFRGHQFKANNTISFKLILNSIQKLKNSEEMSDKILHDGLMNVVSQEINSVNISFFNNTKLPLNFVYTDFVKVYLKRLKLLALPSWYITCFMMTYNNSAVWSHYANNHEGVCLIFNTETQEGDKVIRLKTRNNNKDDHYIARKLYDIQYEQKPIKINYFANLFNMRHEEQCRWFSDSEGNKSSFCDTKRDGEEVLDQYWTNFIKATSIKSKDWQYEHESRLIINNMMNSYRNLEDRKLEYDFNSLDGIIFGINTKDSDKKKVIRIIQEKCKSIGRNQFNFYQAIYNEDIGDIRDIKLQLSNLEIR